MTKTEFTDLAVKIVAALSLVLVAFGVLNPDPGPATTAVGPECAAIVEPLPADSTWRLP